MTKRGGKFFSRSGTRQDVLGSGESLSAARNVVHRAKLHEENESLRDIVLSASENAELPNASHGLATMTFTIIPPSIPEAIRFTVSQTSIHVQQSTLYPVQTVWE